MGDEATPLDVRLRTISDTFLQQLDQVLALEERKRDTPVDDEAFPALARAVEDGVRALLERAQEQTRDADSAHIEAVAEGSSEAIADIPADLTPTGILAQWREAERALADATPGSPEQRELQRRIAAFRGAYQAAYRRQR